jgi:uncharacterized protein DUF4404
MDKQRLLKTLAELRAEIAQADCVEPETVAQLESAMHDLQNELDKRGARQSSDIKPATSKLKDALLKFEAEHPELAVTVGKVADTLAAMGI